MVRVGITPRVFAEYALPILPVALTECQWGIQDFLEDNATFEVRPAIEAKCF